MKSLIIVFLASATMVIASCFHVVAQSDSSTLQRLEKALLDYKKYSSFGQQESTNIDESTMSSFRLLFESNASLFWDLFRSRPQRIHHLLSIDEYIDSVEWIYGGRKPNISYGKEIIELIDKNKKAIIYIQKFTNLPKPNDSNIFKFNKKGLRLRIVFHITKDSILIQNITEDRRLTRIRSLNAEVGYCFAGQVAGGFFGMPESAIDPGLAEGFSFGNLSGYQAGINMDIRLDRKTAEGLVINVGLVYSRNDIAVSVSNYYGSYRRSFDPGENAFEASVFDRSPEITEKITLSGVSLPVTARWFITHRLYVKAGPQLNLMSGKSDIGYNLSHTGGGRYFLLREASLPPDEQQWFYLDEQHEMEDAQYGFFRNREFACTSATAMATLNLSAMLAIGFEARISKLAVGIEPWMTLGITSLTGNAADAEYPVYPSEDYHSFLSTCINPRLNTFGVRVTVGKMFYR